MNQKEPIEAVISGIGGRFPEADSLDQLKKKLFDGVDLITVDNRRWNPDKYNYPKGTGKLLDPKKFDATFFGIHGKLVVAMDLATRMLLEQAFEAIVDSGINPFTLKGRNIAVYSASTLNELEPFDTFSGVYNDGYSVMGVNRSMNANRISYFLNLNGPSCAYDASWIGGIDILKLAANQITDGFIDGAIVAVSNIHLIPAIMGEVAALGTKQSPVLCFDGKCRSFDAEAKGFPRSEAVVCFFLQKKVDAKRNYGTIVHTQTSIFGPRNCSYLDFEEKLVTDFLINFYKECKVDPSTVAYVEADGCAVKRIENVELKSLSSIFCPKRKSPLLIGSVKSNLGHTEGASSFVAMTKAVIAMETGVIPPNLHYKSPCTEVPALVNGQMKVVSKPERLPGELVAVNVAGFNGAAGHVLLRRDAKPKKAEVKKGDLPEDGLPRLILTSARHEEGITHVNNMIKDMPLDVEFVALVNNVHKYNINGHMYRSYTILPGEESIIQQEMKEYGHSKLKVWYVFSGMGSQWNGMGIGLMKFPVFAAAIEKCHQILLPLGVDLKNILTSLDPSLFNNILNSFVGIAAVQIGLVEILNSLGIVPDGIIGHSVGELGCAYADGCFTAEEMILSAYARGRASLETPLIKGMMAAIGLGYNSIKDNLPESIEVACHNSDTSCTLSGPADDVINFVEELKAKQIFAASVNVANIAYHSRYIAKAGPKLLQRLREIIKKPKCRSAKWISSSVPEANWNTPMAQFSSAEYHTNNLLNPVLFEEACRHIPENAIVIEISPHGLLQAILRRALPVHNIPLTSRSATCSIRYLLAAIGKLYINSLLPDVNTLYPEMEYPVSRETPALAPLMTWVHDKDWINISSMEKLKSPGIGDTDMQHLFDSEQLLLGHRINSKLLIPTSKLFILIWETFSELNNNYYISVVFEDVHIYEQIISTELDLSVLSWTVQRGSGNFEIIYQENAKMRRVMEGKISLPETTAEKHQPHIEGDIVGNFKITKEEFYNFFESRGYQLGVYFKTVKEINLIENEYNGQIIWNKDWLLFLDSLFKVNEYFAMEDTEYLFRTSFIKKLKIDVNSLFSENNVNIPFFKDCTTKTLRCGGVEIVGAEFTKYKTDDSQLTLTVEKLKFVPILDTHNDIEQVLLIVLQLTRELNLFSWRNKINQLVIYEVKGDSTTYLSAQLNKALNNQTNVLVECKVVSVGELQSLFHQNLTTPHLILVNSNQLNACVAQFKNKDPVFFLGISSGELLLTDNTIVPVLQYKSSDKFVTLFKKALKANKVNVVQNIDGTNWLLNLREQIGKIENYEQIVLIWNYKPGLGVIKTCKILAKEVYAHRLSCFFIMDKSAPAFSLKNAFYSEQISLGLAVNVFSEGVWGSFQRLLVADMPQTENPKAELTEIRLQEVDLHYLGVNTKNNSVDAGLKPEIEIGYIEYSGYINSGERVMGLAMLDQLKMKINRDNILYWSVPPGWKLEDAATVPLSYTTAYYTLSLLAKLQQGETVLVNAGHSPMGVAAIAVAIQLGGNVFTTVANEQQASALSKQFPQLKRKQILMFEKNFDIELLLATKGEGVLVIVNNISGAVLQKSLQCLARHGKFIQLSKSDMDKKEKIGMFVFLKNTAFYGVATDNVFNASDAWKLKMRSMLEDGIRKGVVKPLARRVFSEDHSNLVTNFLKEKSGQEKVILALKKDLHSKINQNKNKMSFKCYPDKSYLIIGTNDELWIDLAQWLVALGARKILVAVDNRAINSLISSKINTLITQYDTTIIVSSSERANSVKSVSGLLKDVNKLGPLAAIFNLFMEENSTQVKHIDSASRVLAPDLSHFVCLFGGDSAICDERRKAGLPGVAIQCDSPLTKPKTILKYLQQLLNNQDPSPGSQLILVSDSVNTNNLYDIDSSSDTLQDYLPSMQELHDLGAYQHNIPHIEEVTTLSPRFKSLPKCASARIVFIFPGLSLARIESLAKKLYYPSYFVQLSTINQTIEEAAASVVEEILKVNNSGPYTFVSETWSGPMVIEVGQQLEVLGLNVTLFLLDATPLEIQSHVKMIGQPNTPEFDEKLLSLLLKLSVKAKSELSKATNWEERLQSALKSKEVVDKENFTNSLTAFHHMLVAIFNFKPSGNLFQGNVHVLRQKDALGSDVAADLVVYCKKFVKMYIVSDALTHSQLIRSDITTRVINENTNYSWN